MKRSVFIYGLICMFLISCGAENGSDGGTDTVSISKEQLQLNMIVVVDLSDRIDTIKHPSVPSHEFRDIELVKNLTNLFKKEMDSKGAFNAKGSIQVLFYPLPKNPDIAILANQLDVDLTGLDNKKKKNIYDNIETDFQNSLRKIYSQTIETREWIGSDIWEFFKSDIDLYLKDNYRNVVVVITDGYIYHVNSCNMQDKHRYAKITGELLESEGLRNPSTYKAEIQNKDFGLITTRNDLKNVEVLFLELDPNPKYPDFDVMKIVLEKWCREMGIEKIGIYKSMMPNDTKKAINKFWE